MPKIRLALALAALCLPIAACAQSPAHLTESERAIVIQRARDLVMASSALKNPSEIEFVKANKPTLGYYFLARPQADFNIRWALSTEEAIIVRGQGDIFKLEGAVVERK